MDESPSYATFYFDITEDIISYLRVINTSTPGSNVLLPVSYSEERGKLSGANKETNARSNIFMATFAMNSIVYKKGSEVCKTKDLEHFIVICQEYSGNMVSFSGYRSFSDKNGWMFDEPIMEILGN